MQRNEFNSLRDQMYQDICAINEKKGKDYSGDDDALANFKRQAAEAGISPLQVWSVFAGKHWGAIQAYVRNGKVESEPIEERIKDMVLYLFLLYGLIEDTMEDIRNEAALTNMQVEKLGQKIRNAKETNN